MPAGQDTQPPGSADAVGGRGGAWVVGQIILLAAIALAPRRLPGLPAWPVWLTRPAEIVGFLCGAAGASVALAGGRALGTNLTAYPRPRDEARLVQHGIYSHTRNPIYLGLALGALGWALLRKSIPALALVGLLALFLDRKAQREEAWLAEKFPEFEQYRRRVGRWLG
ncbi:MAG TPA: isoprenylcysteine carboxylmethyltransferase family protein [Roseiflexaceae bacterium]|nr:isoprenylcysteine carboxylmethyltransferase family protein [Roseiflexaceae bacterium]